MSAHRLFTQPPPSLPSPVSPSQHTSHLLLNNPFLTNINPIQELANTKQLAQPKKWKNSGEVLFIPHITNLLNRSCRLWNIIQTLPLKDQFILDVGGNSHFDTFMQSHTSHKLFSQKVTDFNDFAVPVFWLAYTWTGWRRVRGVTRWRWRWWGNGRRRSAFCSGSPRGMLATIQEKTVCQVKMQYLYKWE